MKRNKLFLSLSGLLLLTLIIASLSVNVKGASTLDFTFEKDVLYSKSNPEFDDSFNVRNQTIYTGHYPATYSFENEIDGTTGINIVFVDSITGLNNSLIINEFNGHEKVIGIFDNTSAYHVAIQHNINNIEKGTIEFWMASNNVLNETSIGLQNLDSWCIAHRLRDGKFQAKDGYDYVDIFNIVNNEWIHISIEFNCITDKFNTTVNGIKYGIFDFTIPIDVIDRIRINTGTNAITESYIDAIGYSWDKTGYIYSGTYFDVEIQDNIPQGITWDGTYFWVIGNQYDGVYQYTSAGIYTDEHFDVEIQDNIPQGITWDGTYFWVIGDDTDEVYQYTSAGIYTNEHFDVGAQDSQPKGITWDGSSFWVVGSENNEVYQYTNEGNYIGNHFSVGTQDTSPSGITWDGTYFWVIGNDTDEVYQYTSVGVYTNEHFNVRAQDILPSGITWDGTYFWVIGDDTDEVYQYRYKYVETPYNIGDNMIPYKEVSQIDYEVDKFEFAMKNVNVFYDTGDQNPSTWDTTTQGTGISQIGDGAEPTKDKIVYMFGSGVGNNFGIQKTDFTYTEKFIEIDLGLMFIDWSGTASYIMIQIDSSDSTPVVAIAFYNDGRFAYIDEGVQELRDDITIEVNYEIGLLINYEFDLCFIDYVVEGILIETYVIPLLANGKTGLKEIDLDSILSGSEFTIVGFDYVGVYANGLSNAGKGEYGYFSFNLTKPDVNWNFEHHNLFSIIASGTFAIYSNEGTYSIEDSIGLIFDEIEYNNVKILHNIFDTGYTNINNPFLIVFLSDNVFNNITYVNVEGVKLLENTNVYYPTYTHAGIIVNESYFYVDLNNRLQFSLTVNDDNLEYIQAIFDVDDVSSENRSISFVSNINGESKGFFSLDYTDDTSNLMEFPYHQTTTKVILPQTKTIKSFTILITDNDLDDNDLCTGFISSISLIYNPDVGITIFTLNLLGIIVPLIVMLLPPVAMRKRFGITGVIVTFVLMSLICVVSNLIPVWLFFIIAFGCIGFLITKKEGIM